MPRRPPRRRPRLLRLGLAAGYGLVAEGINVTGTVVTTFPDGVVACLPSTTSYLLDALAGALTNVTGTAYNASSLISLQVPGCSSSRRLDGDGEDDAEERRLGAPFTPAVTYVLGTGLGAAVQAMAAVAAAPAAFSASFQGRMAFAGVNVTVIAVQPLQAPDTSFWAGVSMSPLGTFPTDSAAPVSAPRWRLVGRSVAAEWRVSLVRFYKDAACSLPISAIPQRNARGGSRYNGRAFGTPARTGQNIVAAADVFEDNGATWRSAISCPDYADTCYVGFEWLSDQVPVPSTPLYRSVGLLSRCPVAPHCILLQQSTAAGSFAPTVLVQYQVEGGSWTTRLLKAGLVGGTTRIRLPVAR